MWNEYVLKSPSEAKEAVAALEESREILVPVLLIVQAIERDEGALVVRIHLEDALVVTGRLGRLLVR